jgi:hypothetical protein
MTVEVHLLFQGREVSLGTMIADLAHDTLASVRPRVIDKFPRIPAAFVFLGGIDATPFDRSSEFSTSVNQVVNDKGVVRLYLSPRFLPESERQGLLERVLGRKLEEERGPQREPGMEDEAPSDPTEVVDFYAVPRGGAAAAALVDEAWQEMSVR